VLHIALLNPEIPPNTGNIARLCAATGTRLHLVGVLGFRTDDKALKRAGLDYWDAVDVVRHDTFEEFESQQLFTPPTQGPGTIVPGPSRVGEGPSRIWCVETPADMPYTRATFADGDGLLFGCESVGLPAAVREKYAGRLLGIPMPTGAVRSLNLATAAGIVLYEALRQLRDW
jgi:tRNA (cytidine/uridine-2'-O-)-methyltransferase